MNIIYLSVELVIFYTFLIFLYKKYQNLGLYSFIIFAFTISTIMSLKTIDLYGFTLNLGIIPFISVFTATNLINQKRGKDEIKQLTITLLVTTVITYIIFFLISSMHSSTINEFTNASFNNLFLESTRIYFANVVTMLYMLYFNSNLYYYLKKEKNKIWISNIFSTIIINFFTTLLFILLGYAITSSINKIIGMFIIRYIISIIVGILGTIVIYIANKIKEK